MSHYMKPEKGFKCPYRHLGYEIRCLCDRATLLWQITAIHLRTGRTVQSSKHAAARAAWDELVPLLEPKRWRETSAPRQSVPRSGNGGGDSG